MSSQHLLSMDVVLVLYLLYDMLYCYMITMVYTMNTVLCTYDFVLYLSFQVLIHSVVILRMSSLTQMSYLQTRR